MATSVILKGISPGPSLVIQWLRLHASNAGTCVLSPIGELRSYMTRGMTRKKKDIASFF